MAIEIRINKDVGGYPAKFVGPFTIRQTVCLIIAAPICMGIYFGLGSIITTEVAGFLCMFPAAIAVMFGWVKPFGMPMERFLHSVYITMFLSPQTRKYKTVNRHEQAIAILEAAGQDGKAKKPRRKRYRVSKQAVK